MHESASLAARQSTLTGPSVSQANASEIVSTWGLQYPIIWIQFVPKETLKTARFREQTDRAAAIWTNCSLQLFV